ncbi:hypothetical protein WJX82_005745 [Trebouxia sp. C0006]
MSTRVQSKSRTAKNALPQTRSVASGTNVQASRLGLECCKEMKWLGWRVGQEYGRTVTVKNLSADLLHLSWSIPATKSFVLEYPEPIHLSPGMSYSLKVTFCPTRQEPCEDQIQFVCQHGQFSVPLRACLPSVKLDVPEALDFGLAPVKGEICCTLTIHNTGDGAVHCSWEINHPFSMSPDAASIEAGQSADFQCRFQPPEASVYTVLAACHADTGYTATVKVSGVGKYPFLALERSQLQFGDVLVGEQVEQAVQLLNQGLVPADFCMKPLLASNGVADDTIRVSPTRGTLAAGAAASLRVSYTPTTSGTFACEHFAVHTAGGRQVPFSVSGTAVAPSVQLSTGCVSFGSLPANDTSARAVYIQNKADLPVYFEFVTDQQGVFGFDRVRGSVGAMSSAHVTVTFQPKEASNYWRHVTCLVRDGPAMSIDLLGSCYTDQLRPPALAPHHLAQYLCQGTSTTAPGALHGSAYLRVSQGLPAAAFGAEASMAGSSLTADVSELSLGQAESSMVAVSLQPEASGLSGPNQSGVSVLQGQEAWEGFFVSPDPQQAVLLSAHELNFGSCARLSPGGHKTLTVTNSTNAKVTAFLVVPGWQGLSSQSQMQQVFQVFPEQMDIRAHSSATFRVAFRPPLDGQYFSQTIEVVACFKAHRSFRGVSHNAVLPPRTMSVQVVGNTFLHQQEQPDTKGLAQSPGLSCKPERGAVGPQSWQLLGLRFLSHQPGAHTARLTCLINSSQANAQPLAIQTLVCSPGMQLEPAGSLFFKPTCIGAFSQRTLTMHNTARVPLVYQWKVPGHPQTSLGDSALAPMQKIEARGKQVGVRLVGQGTVGAVTLEPSSLDFGTVAVGFPAVRDITLLNQSGGNLCYSITCTAVPVTEAVPSLSAAESSPDAKDSLAQLTEQTNSAQSAEDDGSALHLVVEEPQGFLPARATKTLRLTLNPSRRKQYRLQLVCQTATAQSSSTALSTAPLPPNLSSPPVCAGIEAFSTYPTVMITDIACQGLDKPFVWKQMSCSQINTQLAAEMTEAELVLAAKKLEGGYTTQSALDMLPPFHMDMGVGGVDARPTCVIVRLTNSGSLPVEWDLQRVGDMGVGVELENWVEPSRPRNDKEKLHDFIVQEGLLQLQPPVGQLMPGESTTWTITYRHSALGSHDLSILLAIKDSKQLHLHLRGITVPPTHMCLSLMDQPFQLAPVPIGEREPPRQTYCLRNGGPADLPYSIETAPLQQLIKLNYGYEILKLLESPQGVIPPGGVAGLNFIFSPLEDRLYNVALPIKLGNGAKTAVHLAKPVATSPHKSRRESGTSSAPVVEMVEEVIAEHPAPPLSPYTPGTKLATRAPVHAALTASIRSHFPGLPEVQPMHDGCDAEEPPRPQVLVLNVEGRVLTPDQMRAGLYILPSEAALATSLLQGGAWAPPHISQQSVANEPAADDVQQASAILRDMVADVINCSDVAIALAGLLEEETPTVAELRHGSRLAQTAVPMPTEHQAVYDSPSSSSQVGAAEGAQTMGSSTDRHGDAMTSEEDSADTSGDAGDAVIEKVFLQAEFQAFAEFVLDSACFSLLQESAAGRWQAPDDSMT